MAEGGIFAWKNQRIDTRRGPTVSYEAVHRPLPKPPKNMEWVLDPDTKEWSLETIVNSDAIVNVHDVKVVSNDDDDLDKGDYFEHQVQSMDTFAGICLKYKLTPTELRQANCFSGSNLLLAPNPLRIPKRQRTAVAKPATQIGPKPTPIEKVSQLLLKYPNMTKPEARCYLELNDWNMKEAIANIEEDGGFGEE